MIEDKDLIKQAHSITKSTIAVVVQHYLILTRMAAILDQLRASFEGAIVSLGASIDS